MQGEPDLSWSQGAPAEQPGDPGPVHSILFPGNRDAATRAADPPQSSFFQDLHLEQVIEAVTQGRSEYNLAPLFRTRLSDLDAITYRHSVMQDLARGSLREDIETFAGGLRQVRRHLSRSGQRSYVPERQLWFLHAAQAYADAVTGLTTVLESADLRSRGLTELRTHLTGYVRGAAFQALSDRTQQVLDQLAAVRFCLDLDGSSVVVTRCDDEPSDYPAEIARAFARFQGGGARRDHAERPSQAGGLDRVEIAILDRVARLHPDVFAALEQTSEQHSDFLDETVRTFDREVQLYLSYLSYITPMQQAGLPFAYPEISDRSKELRVEESFDIALAHTMTGGGAGIVTNDVSLTGAQRVLVVTGANQGGKTTFARMVGQLHYLAALGLPVPGRRARLFHVDQLLTHFPTAERLEDLRGRLEDELLRARDLLRQATPDSLVLFNELFGATKAGDATALGAAILEQVEQLDLLCVFVTFLDELAGPAPTRVSVVAQVAPHDPALRTFKVVPQQAQGRAHALAIAEKHGLTYDGLRKRIAP